MARVGIAGRSQVNANLRAVGRALVGRAMRKGMAQAVMPMAKSARQFAPRSAARPRVFPLSRGRRVWVAQDLVHGLLKKSMGWTVKTYRGSKATVGLVGPRRNVWGRAGGLGYVKKAHEAGVSRRAGWMVQKPTKYAHLVEKGTRAHGYRDRERAGWPHRTRGLHPGAAPQAFLKQARDLHRRGALAALQVILADEVRRGGRP